MAVNSPNDICNMALASLGNYGTVSDITTPTNDKERALAVWYDICRQFVLQLLMPNFALSRIITAQLEEVPAFGYSYFYEYPENALKILGIDEAKYKRNEHSVELTPLGVKAIAHDYDYEDGIPLRIIKDVEDITLWTPEAKLLLSQYLAAYAALPITQDVNKAAALRAALPAEISSASAINAQENVPIRISNSLFKASRNFNSPNYTNKK